MADDPKPGDTSKSPEEIELEKQVTLAKLKNDIAQFDFNAIKAKKDAEDLRSPKSLKNRTEADKSIAQGRKEVYLAEKEMVKGPEVTPPIGKITTTGIFIESRILAQKTLRKAMSAMFTHMAVQEQFKNKIITLILYNAADFPLMEMYASMIATMNGLDKAYVAAVKKTDDV